MKIEAHRAQALCGRSTMPGKSGKKKLLEQFDSSALYLALQ